jgi:hypothetical protein
MSGHKVLFGHKSARIEGSPGMAMPLSASGGHR